jgi:hypothetical protein
MTKKEKRALENSSSPFTLVFAISLILFDIVSGNRYGEINNKATTLTKQIPVIFSALFIPEEIKNFILKEF